MNTIDAKLEAKRNSFENLLRGAVTRASDKAWENCDYVACDKIQKIKERLVLSIQSVENELYPITIRNDIYDQEANLDFI